MLSQFLLDCIFGSFVAQPIYVLQREVLKSRNREVVDLFENGIGIHHAGMLRADRGLTERLFSDGLLRVSCPLVLFFQPNFLWLLPNNVIYSLTVSLFSQCYCKCFRYLFALQHWHGE